MNARTRSLAMVAVCIICTGQANTQPSASREQTIALILEAMAAAHGPIRVERQMVEKSIMDSLLRATRVYKTPSQLCDPELPKCVERVREVIATDVDRLTVLMPTLIPVRLAKAWQEKSDEPTIKQTLELLGGPRRDTEIPSLNARYMAVSLAMSTASKIISEESEALYDKVAAATVDLPRPKPPRVPMYAPVPAPRPTPKQP